MRNEMTTTTSARTRDEMLRRCHTAPVGERKQRPTGPAQRLKRRRARLVTLRAAFDRADPELAAQCPPVACSLKAARPDALAPRASIPSAPRANAQHLVIGLEQRARHDRRPIRCGAALLALLIAGLLGAAPARAGTYPMYQCGGGTASVAPGWSVFTYNTQASAVVSNGCAAGGTLGVYAFTGQPGAVTENGDSGSQVGLALNVPASVPDVTIAGISAQVTASSVTGDDAFLGFASAGEGLPGGAELPYGSAAPYTASDQWTLPGGARDFEAYVNCSTDRSSPTCQFSQSTQVPALSDIVVTLADDAPPSIAQVGGTLATAAAVGATVSGVQTLSLQATDPDAGVRSVTITLTPATGAPFLDTIDYGAQCAYDSWNACPLSEQASAAIDTSTLSQGTYAVQVTVTDAAGNTKTLELGTVTTKTNPHLPNGSPCAGVKLALTLDGRRKLARVRYGSRVLIGGLLHCGATPDSGALVTVSGGGLRTAVSTNAHGRFAFLVPPGPSRTLTFTYMAYSDSSVPAARARASIPVYPVISLWIAPRATHNGDTILWRGAVIGGPYPASGLTLLVQVRVGRRWQTFDQLLTHDGHFTYAYTFLRTTSTITYEFRVALPISGAADYPYLPAASRRVSVHVSP